MENKNITKFHQITKDCRVVIILIALASLIFYWYVYRPAHIREVCLLAYPQSAFGSGGILLELPSLNPKPDYNLCLRRHGL